MSFTQLDLNENINKAIQACGYTTPTPIQAQSIPVIMAGKDLVACAQTGTGKTAAFVLPALHRLSLQKPSKKTKILILTPTRELASQITKAAGMYGKFLRFNIVSLVGGMSYYHQIKDLARGADVIVATPGRLLDHINSKRVDLSHVEMLVLDEADRMLDMGFIDDVKAISEMTPDARQTLLFSATVDKQLTSVIRALQKNPTWIDLSGEKVTAPKIKQELYKASSQQHKMRLLKHFLSNGNMYKAIIFSATKINADKLANQLCHDGYSAAALHGDLRQNVRNRTVEDLRRGKIQFLVATDVAARGIDINDVTHVINFDLPRFSEDYVHRIGRTGRAGKEGVAISFVLPTDTRHVKNIERYTGQRFQIINKVEGMGALPDHHESRADKAPFVDDHSAYPVSKQIRPSADDYRPFKKRSIAKEFPAREERRGKPTRDDGAPRRSFGDSKERFGSSERRDRPARDDAAPRRSFGDSKERFGSSERRDRPARDDAAPRRSFGGSKERFDSSERRERSARDDAKPRRSFAAGKSRFGASDTRGKSTREVTARPKKQYDVAAGRLQTDSVKEIKGSRGNENRPFKKRQASKEGSVFKKRKSVE